MVCVSGNLCHAFPFVFIDRQNELPLTYWLTFQKLVVARGWARDSVRVFQVGGRRPITCPITCVPLRVCVSRKLESKAGAYT